MKLIQITTRGLKGSWWNKFIDNFFLAEQTGETWQIKHLSNIYGNVCGDLNNGKEIPATYCHMMPHIK